METSGANAGRVPEQAAAKDELPQEGRRRREAPAAAAAQRSDRRVVGGAWLFLLHELATRLGVRSYFKLPAAPARKMLHSNASLAKCGLNTTENGPFTKWVA